jgi:hypothetical protein
MGQTALSHGKLFIKCRVMATSSSLQDPSRGRMPNTEFYKIIEAAKKVKDKGKWNIGTIKNTV